VPAAKRKQIQAGRAHSRLQDTVAKSPVEQGGPMSATKKRMVATILVACSWASAWAQDIEVIKVNTALVTINISVINNHGQRLTGLQAKDFLVTDDGQPVQPGFFDSNGPVSIVFVIDISSSNFFRAANQNLRVEFSANFIDL
jgi:hypothetical protein